MGKRRSHEPAREDRRGAAGRRQSKDDGAAHLDSNRSAVIRPSQGARPANRPAAPFRGWALAVLLVLVGLTVITYGPVAHFDFVSIDDQVYVGDNPLLRAGLSWTTFWQVLGSTYANFWHPLTVLSLMLDARLFGIRPGPMHVTNVLLHLAATSLLFVVLYRATGARVRSALVAVLFAVHPLHVESVAWIAQRKDVLSTLFWMLTLAAYASYARAPRWPRYALALFFFALGLMAKPMLVSLPIVLLLFDAWPLGRVSLAREADAGGGWPVLSRGWLPLVLEKVPFLALSILASIVAFVAQRQGGAVASLQGFSLAGRLANAPIAFVAYLGKTVWPAVLTVFYPYPLTPRILAAVGAALVLLAITAVVIRMAARRPYLAVGWFWYVVTLLPVSGIVQVGSHAMADRYTYVPLIGLFIAIAWGIADIAGEHRTRRAVAAAAACVGVAALVVVGRTQVMTWQNSATLWQHAVDVMADNYYAHNAFGLELAGQGRTREALLHYEAASRLAPGFPNADNNTGLLLEARGKTNEAIEHYREALRRAPDYHAAQVNLGNALVKVGRAGESVAHYEAALAAGWDEAGTRANLANAFMETRRYEEALRQLEISVRLDPTSARTRYNFGNALDRAGRSDLAVAQYREALRLGPPTADVLDNLGIALGHLGRPAEAIEAFEGALRLEPGAVSTRLNLGNALLGAGRNEDAAAEFRAVLQARASDAQAHVGLGTALFNVGRLQEALSEHRVGVALGPNLADAHYNLAVTLQALGRLAEAVAEFEQTLRLEGGSPDVHVSLAVLYERLGRFRESSAHYTEALRMKPGFTQASEGLARVAKAVGRR